MKPTPGKQYTTVSGDTLENIASRAYGDPCKWTLIYNAFQKAVKTDTQEEVFPGEVINIPIDPVLNNLRKQQRS